MKQLEFIFDILEAKKADFDKGKKIVDGMSRRAARRKAERDAKKKKR